MQPEGLPEGLEAGTANVVGIAGLLEGVRFIEGRGVDAIARHEEEWINHFLAGLASLPGVRVLSNGFACRRVALATFSVDGFASQEVASILDSSFDIAIRAGLHCAPAVHQAKETFPDGAIRASASVQNSISDAEGLLRALADILGQSR
jgi:selenocysteine lyase/cysteine desulfurase